MDYLSIIEDYNSLDNEAKKKAVKDIFSIDEGRPLAAYIGEDSTRSVLRIIADAGSRAESLTKENSRLFLRLLESEDPKVRMLTAEILGNAGGFDSELIKACRAEQTMFTLPSYLLAIGRSKTPAAKRYLENYDLRSEVEKHIAEEKEALRKALANFIERKNVSVRLSENDVLLLDCANPGITAAEAKEKGIKAKRSGRYVLAGGLKKYSDIFALRTFQTAYILLGKTTWDDMSSKLNSLVGAIRSRISETNYRLEISGVTHEKRASVMTSCIDALEGLINTPSSYSFEIELRDTGSCVLILADPHLDRRFEYRKKAVSASISPSVAAAVCFAAKDYFDGYDRVLDDFCGSGTMLFERAFYPHFSLTGVDISQTAVDAAKENAVAAGRKAKFFHADALRFDGKEYDEVICNMPFGIRVSSHKKNVELYNAYINLLPSIIKKGGHAFLYTHEKTLIEDIFRKKNIKVISKTTFDAGGLYPALYIIGF